MRVLLTGAFGNIGAHTLEEVVRRGHVVRCFDIPTRANRRTARRFARAPGIEIVWGDLRQDEDVAQAVRDIDVVVHLAFVIPTLSATGVGSEDRPEWAREINVGGTRRLIEALGRQPVPPRLIFASSLHIYGRTADRTPPLRVSDPIEPVEHYARHKAECEALVRASGLEWAILRLPATLPVRLVLDPGMFDVPLENRIEYGHVRDVAAAFGAAVESEKVWGRTLLIGGGTNCQYTYGEMVERILEASGVGMLPKEAFTRTPFPTDWLDTEESQRLLRYQSRTLDDYAADLRRLLGFRRALVRVFRPIVRRWLLQRSPYWEAWTGRMSGVAVVTGGSGGIGAATAQRLARAGMKVVLVARTRARLEDVATAIRQEGGQAAILEGDLASEADCRRVYERSSEFFGAPDVLVNGAGIGWYGYGEEMPWPTASEMIEVNMVSVARLTLLFLADMKPRGKGHIVNIGSVVGGLPSQGVALYSATKSFVDTFTSSLFRELRGSGVNVSVVRPGAVGTEMLGVLAFSSGELRMPLQRLSIEPEAVASRVLSLIRRPRRVAYVPSALAVVPWIELAFGWAMDRLGPIALRRQRGRPGRSV